MSWKSKWGKCHVCGGQIGMCKHTSSAVAKMEELSKKNKTPTYSHPLSKDTATAWKKLIANKQVAVPKTTKEYLDKFSKMAAENVQKNFSAFHMPVFTHVNFPDVGPVNLKTADPASAPYGYIGNMDHVHKMQQEVREAYARSIEIFVTSYGFEKIPRYTPYKLRETNHGVQTITPMVLSIEDLKAALCGARSRLLEGKSQGEACVYFNTYLPVPPGYTPLRPSDLHTEHSLGWYVKSLLMECSAKVAGEDVYLKAELPEFLKDIILNDLILPVEKPKDTEVVELTLTGLTKEEAEHVLKTIAQSKSGQSVVVSKKVRKDEGTGSKGVIFWEFESSSSSVNGTPLKWIAQLNEDGTLSCQCRGWTVGSAKSPNGRFCKHTKALEAEFNIPALYKKWKKGEPLGEEFVQAGSPEASLVVQTPAKKAAAGGSIKFKRVIEL